MKSGSAMLVRNLNNNRFAAWSETTSQMFVVWCIFCLILDHKELGTVVFTEDH
jgi:hypothetical protein